MTQLAGIKAQVDCLRLPGSYGESPAIGAPNQLQQPFDAAQPDQTCVADITSIKTHVGFLYLASAINLYSRRVVGRSTQSRMHMELVLSALLMAIWRREPRSEVIIHSDQGSQFTSHEWQKFLQTHASMSRRGIMLTRKASSSSSKARTDQATELQRPRRGSAGRV